MIQSGYLLEFTLPLDDVDVPLCLSLRLDATYPSSLPCISSLQCDALRGPALRALRKEVQDFISNQTPGAEMVFAITSEAQQRASEAAAKLSYQPFTKL